LFEDPEIEGLKLVTPRKFGDEGVCETHNAATWEKAGLHYQFVQDIQSLSRAVGTVRGLHFQAAPFAQNKLVRVVRGRILDVAVDLRCPSPTFGRHVAVELSPENWRQLLIPIGFAHGFVTLEPDPDVLYKVTDFYSPQHDFGLAWDDPDLGVDWPVGPEREAFGAGPAMAAAPRSRPGLPMSLRLGVTGQVVSALIERAPRDVEIIALGRPQLDLGVRNAVLASLRHAGCDAIVNAAAYAQVDKVESEPERAMPVNGDGAGNVADATAELGAPLLHLSTDYVFDGGLDRPYREDDPTGPLTAYGRSKVAGDEQIAARHQNHLILRTAWVYSRFGVNFVKTMLRLGAQRDEVGVVADQWGNPTNALDIADALFALAQRLIADPSPNLRGVFHLAGAGEATWADVAERLGRKPVRVRRITTADYPAPSRRPANSRLDAAKLRENFGLSPPPWRGSLENCVVRLVSSPQ
jgi:dTDP-4-dehydrorhamnose reductase